MRHLNVLSSAKIAGVRSMTTDLYKDDFSRLTDIEIYGAIEAFTRISEPLNVRPRESFVLDFKEEWSERALRTVAGFAHTFGGLLVVGVSEKDGQPGQLVGVESPGELKTSIASSIATNISPTPAYEIAECSLPGNAARKLAVVRVRPGSQLFYITRKGERPIYVRNEDESVPADAAQLRSLIDRRDRSSQSHVETANRFTRLRNEVALRKTAKLEGSNEIPTNLQIILAPIECPSLSLDSSVEQIFRKLLTRNFAFRYSSGTCDRSDERYISFYDWRWFRSSDRRESVWRLTSDGDVAYSTQARVQPGNNANPSWSLGDTLTDLLLLLAVARSLWRETSSYYGEAQLLLSLNLQNLAFLPSSTADLWPDSTPEAFYRSENFNTALQDSVVSLASQPSTTTLATAVFNSGLPYNSDGIAEMVANILNQLLRGLGHSADLKMLRRAVEVFLDAAR
jgi:hypothetical protein